MDQEERREGGINKCTGSAAGNVGKFQEAKEWGSGHGWRGAHHPVHPSDIPDWGAEQNPLTAFQLTEPGKTWKVSVAFPKHINQIILKISGIHPVQPASVILHQANQITL